MPDSASEPPNGGMSRQLQQLWRKLTRGRKIALVAAGLGTLVGLAYVTQSSDSTDYEVLYSGLSAEDAGGVIERLRSDSIPYRVGAGGGFIEVPADRVNELRISMAAAGYPQSGGVGFEIFDGQSLGTTSFVERVNYRRALQGELSRTISALSGVKSARVHIALGRRSVFKDADQVPTASVTLRMQPASSLGKAEVRGIVHLVAASVEGMTPERVSVIDQRGRVLSVSEDDAGSSEAQSSMEKTLADRVSSMLERVVGRDHLSVVVTAVMDRSKVDQTEELYDKDKYALRSEARTVEGAGANASVAGVAGARGNLPGAPAPTKAAAGAGTQRLTETRNYEVNKVVRRTRMPAARLQKLHVAVLVDYVPGKPAEDGTPGAMVPRSAEQLEQIAAIARQAAGIDPARGDQIEIRNVEFDRGDVVAEEDPPEPVAATNPLPVPIPVAVAAGVGLLLLIIIVVVVLKRRKRKSVGAAPDFVSLPAPIAAVERALSEAGEIAALGSGAPTLELAARDVGARVAEAVRTDPVRAAGVLKNWLAEARAAEAAQ